MNVQTMRWIDRVAGVPLCHAVGRWNRSSAALRRAPVKKTSDTVVVFKMFGLGSILLAFPFLEALKKARPSATIVVVTFAPNRELLERVLLPVHVIALRTSSFTAFCRDTFQAVRTLRRMKPSEAFDLEFFSKFTTLLSALSGAPRRHGYHLAAQWRRLNITNAVPWRPGVHVADMFLDLLPVNARRPEVVTVALKKPTTAEHASLSRMLTANGVDGRRLVAVNVNAGTTSLERRWPLDRFASVIADYVDRNPETAVILTGDTSERPYVEHLFQANRSLIGRAFNYAGRLSLGEFLALIERVPWLLTNDSAPMHMAASLGTPVVALFGPESPAMYAPLGKSRILYAALPCSPCLSVYHAKQFSCPYDALCMRSLDPKDVLDALTAIEQEQFVRRERA